MPRPSVVAAVLLGLAVGACHRPPPPRPAPSPVPGDHGRPAPPPPESPAEPPPESPAGTPADSPAEPGGEGRPDTGSAAGASPSADAFAREVERLRNLGPLYTPFDVGPRLLWDEASEALLTDRLLPVLREHELPSATKALFWLLVGGDGAVADVVIQTSSGNRAFDRAAAEVARGLRFRPATTNQRPHAVWVIRGISLLMQ